MIFTVTLNPAVDRELIVTEMVFDSVLRAVEARVDFGGKGFNVARLLKGLGADCVCVGFLGGRTGELLQDGLRSLGIDTDFVWVPGETRTNISIVETVQSRYLKVNEKGPVISAEKQAELLDKIRSLAQPGDWWILAGSLPPGVPDTFYADIIRILNKKQARTVLDTSGAALRAGCLEKPYLAKPNAEEVHTLTGMSVDTLPELTVAARAILALGVENLVISMGKEGAILQSAEGAFLARSPAVMEKNPIGAGDSMVGGLIWGLTQGMSLKEALSWGVASGAATASLSGTEVGSRPLIESLHQQARIEPLT
ncbi:MAG TPA: 1-phosphofructokinase [Anaerolineaceae bacterium]|nr:1-phosphofructokinase [Anaerolineaceae bacterium]HPN53551.1 1-phosphofructokinase [Anaerolineaceae bacterium]